MNNGSIWGFPQIGGTQNAGFIVEHPIYKWMMTGGVPLWLRRPLLGRISAWDQNTGCFFHVAFPLATTFIFFRRSQNLFKGSLPLNPLYYLYWNQTNQNNLPIWLLWDPDKNQTQNPHVLWGMLIIPSWGPVRSGFAGFSDICLES